MNKSVYDADGDGVVDNAEQIAGYTPTSSDPWGHLPVVRGGDGVMEIGKYIDFHAASGGSTDYDYRFTSGSGSITGSGAITAPAFHGPSDSATKLSTARKINGVSFDGSADITVSLADTMYYDAHAISSPGLYHNVPGSCTNYPDGSNSWIIEAKKQGYDGGIACIAQSTSIDSLYICHKDASGNWSSWVKL